jgi:hypothetical protein
LREFIRGRRAALAGFMEQGAALELNGDVLIVAPRNDIYIRYLSDNRNVIAELASELYGRRIRAEVAPLDGSAIGAGVAEAAPAPMLAAPAPTSDPGPNGGLTAPAAGSSGGPPQTQAEARQALYADPVARRIFDEFEARLVEVRLQPAPARGSSGEPAAEKK